jgi:hypothetical protein
MPKTHRGDVEGHGEKHHVVLFEDLQITTAVCLEGFQKRNGMLFPMALHSSMVSFSDRDAA